MDGSIAPLVRVALSASAGSSRSARSTGISPAIAAFFLVDNHIDLTAEFLVAWFNHLRVIVEPRLSRVTHVQEGHTGFGEWTQIFQRRGYRHEAPQRGIFLLS